MSQRRPVQFRGVAGQDESDGTRRSQCRQFRLDLRAMRVIEALERADQAGLRKVAHWNCGLRIADCGFGSVSRNFERAAKCDLSADSKTSDTQMLRVSRRSFPIRNLQSAIRN